jgi:hypothetical protein
MDKSILRQRDRISQKNSTEAKKHLWYCLHTNRLEYKIVGFLYLEKYLKTLSHDIAHNIIQILSAGEEA